ncbi:hypothetical protein Q8F55_004834 [Vanrija albida]|uniref:F-box domain-containing protein n=1 Tax=Vanrija albida TaxID=181172 RepID=A0ABR3Q0Q7_9TREE
MHPAHASQHPATPASIIINTPHIVDAIMAYATSSTLATCLRVSKGLHHTAGKVLYHTVRLDKSNMGGFFCGIWAGNASDEDTGSVADGPSSPTLPAQTKNATPRHMNFKRRLLANVRVLSLGSHYEPVCRLFRYEAPTLLPCLDTLRIVRFPASMHSLQSLCGGHECPFFAAAVARRLVIRNLDARPPGRFGCPKRFYTDTNDRTFEEVVWVLPTKGKVYTKRSLIYVRSYFPKARITFLFHPTWELWEERPDLAASSDALYKPLPVPPSAMVEILVLPKDVVSPPMPTVIGLETVEFSTNDSDELVEAFATESPHLPLTPDRLHQAVRDEVSTSAFRLNKDPVEFPEDIAYYTLEEYAAFEASERAGVLDDGLPGSSW